ncbi:hypothetical protein [Streptomyces avermitilis]|uniref:hypothetical protein n=1 Tax=Streptomyces avermitilis TaxID=33903 RepID=UPI00382ABE95
MLAVPVALPVHGPPGKPYLPKVAAGGDLLHYATARDAWERRNQGEGSKGQRTYDWARFEVSLPAQEPADGFAHRLLLRRSTDKSQLQDLRLYYLADMRAPVSNSSRSAGCRMCWVMKLRSPRPTHHRARCGLPGLRRGCRWSTRGGRRDTTDIGRCEVTSATTLREG